MADGEQPTAVPPKPHYVKPLVRVLDMGDSGKIPSAFEGTFSGTPLGEAS
jgi:hypothetical protein